MEEDSFGGESDGNRGYVLNLRSYVVGNLGASDLEIDVLQRERRSDI